jgi:uncharacterized peroxidase-related enzyme
MPAYIKPLDPNLPELKPFVEKAFERMGFVPNSMLTMANKPAFMKSVLPMLYYMNSPDCTINEDLREMIAFMVSYGSGCRYCQAHSAHGAEKYGVSEEKIANLWNYQNSDLFSAAERVALDFSFAAGQQPSAAEQSHYDALAEYFSQEQIIDIVAICSIYGFLNRWNDTVGTQLEDAPLSYTSQALEGSDWEVGKHG